MAKSKSRVIKLESSSLTVSLFKFSEANKLDGFQCMWKKNTHEPKLIIAVYRDETFFLSLKEDDMSSHTLCIN